MKRLITYLLTFLVLTSCPQELIIDEALTANFQAADNPHLKIDKMCALQNYMTLNFKRSFNNNLLFKR